MKGTHTMANRLATLALAAALGTALASSPALAQTVGVNAAIRNLVQVKTARDAAPRRAVLRERIALGDNVSTGAASSLQILLLDRTSFTVGANARATIDRFVYDPSRASSAVGASVARGAFRFMSGKPTRNAPGQSSVRTPTASIGIRGTILEGVVGEDALRIAGGESAVGAAAGSDAGNATLVILRGPGAASQGDEKPGAVDVTIGGNTVELASPGAALFIPAPGAAPIGPFAMSDDGLAAVAALLRPEASPPAPGSDVMFEGNPVIDMLIECSGGFQSPVSPGQSSSSSSSSSSCSHGSSSGT